MRGIHQIGVPRIILRLESHTKIDIHNDFSRVSQREGNEEPVEIE